jgi:hypothetical protein
MCCRCRAIQHHQRAAQPAFDDTQPADTGAEGELASAPSPPLSASACRRRPVHTRGHHRPAQGAKGVPDRAGIDLYAGLVVERVGHSRWQSPDVCHKPRVAWVSPLEQVYRTRGEPDDDEPPF